MNACVCKSVRMSLLSVFVSNDPFSRKIVRKLLSEKGYSILLCFFLFATANNNVIANVRNYMGSKMICGKKIFNKCIKLVSFHYNVKPYGIYNNYG